MTAYAPTARARPRPRDQPRIVTGLWQVADMERGAARPRPRPGGGALADYAPPGFDTFDMADHYGSAELIAGALPRPAGARRAAAFTKWCPPPGPMTPRRRARTASRSARSGSASRPLDLLQLHWWTFEHPGYIDALRELARAARGGR